MPVRGVAQALGCQVEWNGATQSVKLYKDIVPGDTYLMEVCPPYATGGEYEKFLQTDGNNFSMSGEKYTNGFTNCTANGGHALFNLNGKYSSVNLTVGQVDSSLFKEDIRATFIVDGKTVKEIDIIADELAKNISIPVNYGLQLKILITDIKGSYNSTWTRIGFGNITAK